MKDLVSELLAGSPRALARLLTYIENGSDEATSALARIYPHTGRAHLVGVTGAPGTGKSTLVNSLAKAYRAAGQTVGIVAVDPTSPFSGGAVLGDRIRMRDLTGDRGVFIRSMATRGSLGGLARTTGDAVRALDAAGYDVVLIETVGAGQSEIDIAREAQTTVVVEAPGLGDDIQTIKAGILEIADILVVNKADRPDAQNTVRALRAMLDLGTNRPHNRWHEARPLTGHPAPEHPEEPEGEPWQTPVVQTVAINDTGADALLTAINEHRAFLRRSRRLQLWERHRLERDLSTRLQDALLADFLRHISREKLESTVNRLASRDIDPNTAVRQLLTYWQDNRDSHVQTQYQE